LSVDKLFFALDRLGGVASTKELRSAGVDRGRLDVAVQYGKVIRVRKALWALPDVPAEVINALRLGGRLACVSALAFHGEIDETPSPLHIEVLLVSSGTKAAAAGAAGAVRHWSRYPHGHRLAVDQETAWAQYETCAHREA
jgi:hypothetical protein